MYRFTDFELKFKKVVNMENEKFTPTGWHWKITPEQIEKIKERDRDTVNQVYFDNLDKFKRIAYRFCRNTKRLSYYLDCVQQIYVDILDYDFSCARKLYWSLYHSFYRAVGYTRYNTVSLDKAIFDDNDATFHDIMPSCDRVLTEVEKQEYERHALEIIAAQTQLTERNKDFLTAYAFNCLAYRGLFAYEYAQAFAT